MATRIEASVDTPALIASADRSDAYHPLFYRLFSAPPLLVTISSVITEGHGWFLKRYDRTRALQFLAMVEQMTFLKILQFGAAELSGATDMLRKFLDQDLTLVDAGGLHVMRERRIKLCWSTDLHFGMMGVPLVIHQH